MSDDQVGELKAKQKQLEEQYRSALIALGVEEQYALGRIKSARSTPREQKQMKAIYEAHQGGLLKIKEIKVTCAKMITGLNMNPTCRVLIGHNIKLNAHSNASPGSRCC